MCRLLGQVSLAPRGASDVLAEVPWSLLEQSDARAKDPQKDGWGLGYFAGRRVRVVKSPRPIFREAARFRSAAAKARARVVLGHIRAASNPRGVPAGRLINLANTQPFTDGKWIFCHNGTLSIPAEVERWLGPYRNRVRGINDSEVFFWQMRKFIDVHGSVPEAMKACVREIWGLWAGCRRRYPRLKAPYTGLNALISDGRALYGLCHYTLPVSRRAFFSGQPWGMMSVARRGDRVLIASEDLDEKGWGRLGKAEIVSAIPEKGRLVVRRERFDPWEGR
ncbi:MAG: class II glutamine amidotransferase [Elusimicrobia bacterium]|nr:class II glutamine amidotransferase [Elusimicrobiota bacterium]